ncbi:MAG: SLBB domain-containing protein [Minwuiales bacterium]|nr:SLBB domain-containing protein [Minwuiales bacterium]
MKATIVGATMLLALQQTPTFAQGLGVESLGTLGTLLDQIGDLQSSGVVNIRRQSPVDRARDKADKEAQGSLKEERPTDDLNGFSKRELELLLQQFCAGTSDKDADELRVIASELSRLEADYCLRAKEVLRQYGYEIFDAAIDPQRLSVGAIANDYVLGVGDELVVSFHGQQPTTITTNVDREGRVILPNLPPISAAGRAFGQFRRELETRTASAMLGTQVFASVANVRLLSVVIAGEVELPGPHQVTGLSSVIDALNMAGGIKKTGSLRRIQVHRGDKIFWVDLYDLMFSSGSTHQLGVMDGDRIVVPAVGPTVAVAGDVKRPGIYELSEGFSSSSKEAVLTFAGGPLRPRGNRWVRITFEDSGGQLVVEHDNDDVFKVLDGDILMAQRRQDIQTGTVELLGHVRVPGQRSLANVQTVRGLVSSPRALRDDPYLPFAVLETTDAATQARRLFPVDLQQILEGENDFKLREFDRLIVLSSEDIRYLSSPDVQEIIFSDETASLFPVPDENKTDSGALSLGDDTASGLLSSVASLTGDRSSPQRETGTSRPDDATAESGEEEGEDPQEAFLCDGLVRLKEIVRSGRRGRYANAVRLVDDENGKRPSVRLPCPDLFDAHGDLLPFALEHVVAVNGEVRRPGAYPVADNTALAALIAVSGGLTREVDLTRLEVSRFDPDPYKGLSDTSRKMVDLNQTPIEDIAVSPGDVVRFNAVFTDRDSGPVVLLGEFVRPGIYGIRRGETLSEVIRRAGGLTEQAYPYGSIFLRERVRQVEQQGFVRASRELNSALAVAAVRRGVDPRALITLQQISEQLGKVQAIGRIVIEADPTVLQVRRELDTVLEPGDRVFVPKRPNFVSVLGDVLNPGALQFVAGTKGDEYIRQAGGFQRSADEDRVFVVFPNGRAQPLSLSAWNYSPVQIPPGSTIVVPKDPIPFDLFTFTREITDLVSKVALTAASLKVLSD